jgi:hypothetical protein
MTTLSNSTPIISNKQSYRLLPYTQWPQLHHCPFTDISPCLSGALNHVAQRPHDRERASLIKSGNVFIYEEHSSSIKRWTDDYHPMKYAEAAIDLCAYSTFGIDDAFLRRSLSKTLLMCVFCRQSNDFISRASSVASHTTRIESITSFDTTHGVPPESLPDWATQPGTLSGNIWDLRKTSVFWLHSRFPADFTTQDKARSPRSTSTTIVSQHSSTWTKSHS